MTLNALTQQSTQARRNKLEDVGYIPEVFCWTKMGTEAGQSLDKILQRKELERQAGGGTFAWGIGNSLGTAAELAKRVSPNGEVDVLFTPMKSAPKAVDVSPSQLLVWLNYHAGDDKTACLPPHMLVTSRGGSDKRSHYALICRADTAIANGDEYGAFDASDVRNLASRNPIGASQVTSVVHYERGSIDVGKPYRVAFKAKLHAEGFVRLASPVPMDEALMELYRQICQSVSIKEWCDGIQNLKAAARARICVRHYQQNLFQSNGG